MVFAGGVLIIASAFPHALLGWPAMARELAPAALAPDLVGGLAAGWLFGSAAMLALGAVVVLAARELPSSALARRVALAVGLAYALFGLAAWVARSFHPHFLGFVGIGALIVAGAFGSRPRRS
jgi:hypothetical protein